MTNNENISLFFGGIVKQKVNEELFHLIWNFQYGMIESVSIFFVISTPFILAKCYF